VHLLIPLLGFERDRVVARWSPFKTLSQPAAVSTDFDYYFAFTG
jgi:hypothetical protein